LLRGGGDVINDLFLHICSISNLLKAWKEFKQGKNNKQDILEFELHLEHNIFTLHDQLISGTYTHDIYTDFYVCDPKRRHIHKATVRDRVLHQAVFRVFYEIFDKYFIYDSYSSRSNKGTHAGVTRLQTAIRKQTNNWKQVSYLLKCDIRKFFDSIDHIILLKLLTRKITDERVIKLLELFFRSFEKSPNKGIPLGNVTSQLFAYVYMNELDQYVKHVLKCNYYFRYCDDFVIIGNSQRELIGILENIKISSCKNYYYNYIHIK
jgi:RNA-directed DNA polymerase